MISFKEFLVELFDKPWELKDISDSRLGKIMQTQVHKRTNGEAKNIRLHKAEGNNGYVLEFHHRGALEVHHIDDFGNSGSMHKLAKPNPRFISTIKHKIQNHVLNNGPLQVRVIGSTKDGMVDHYHKIAKRLEKKNSISVGEPSKHSNIDNNKEPRKEFIIHARHVVNEELLYIFKQELKKE